MAQYRRHHGGLFRNLSWRQLRPIGRQSPAAALFLRNWWRCLGVMDPVPPIVPVGEGSHATPSEVSVTWFGYPQAVKSVTS